jgi:hypothetical protein
MNVAARKTTHPERSGPRSIAAHDREARTKFEQSFFDFVPMLGKLRSVGLILALRTAFCLYGGSHGLDSYLVILLSETAVTPCFAFFLMRFG